MPPGLDPGGFQSQGEFSDAVGLATESLGFSLGGNLIQAYLNEGGSPGAEYAGTSTSGGTVAYDANEHSGTQSLRIVRTSAAAVGALGANLPWISTGIPHQNGPALQGEFWIYVNSLPSSVAVPIFHAGANLSQNAELWLSPSGQLRARQQHSATGSFSVASATSITTGQWFKISWMLDISLPDLSTIRFWVNQDSPVTFRWANRYGTQDADQILNVSYGCMTTVQPAASNFDICFDDQLIFSIPGFRDGMLQYIGNEADAITNFEYDSTTTTGGTVTLVTSQFHDGTTALRVNRTSAAQVCAETCGMTITGYVPHRAICGSFWIRVASYPSGVGDTPIFTAYHATGDNFDITLSNTGQVRARRQNGNLSSGAEQSSYSATTVSLNTWTQIFWTSDNSTGTMIGTVAVGSDAPQSVSWANAVEIHPWVDFGCKTFTTASNFDIYFDESYVFEGATYPVAAQPNVVFPACTSAGTATATATAFRIKLPNRTSVGTAIADETALILRAPFPTTPILDNFNRADGALGGNWRRQLRSSVTNALTIVSNQLTSTLGNADGYWSAQTFGNDEEAYLTVGSLFSTSGFQIHVRCSNMGTSTFNSYCVAYDADTGPGAPGIISIFRTISGSVTTLMTIDAPSGDLGAGDKLGIRVVGNVIQAFVKYGANPWINPMSVVDSSLATGNTVGPWTNESLCTYDDFGGGTYVTQTLPVETSDGTSSATGNNLKIRLPNQSSAGTSGSTATALRIRLPSRTSAGVGTATAVALLVKLPSRTSAGTGSVSANNIKIRLPSRTSAGSATGSSVTNLRALLQARTSAGTSTATATALRIKLPTATSAGTSTFTQGGLKIRLPSRTSAGTSSIAQSGLRDKFSPLTSAGTSSTSATGLKIRLPSRTSAGTATATATALKLGLHSSSAGTSTATATAFRIRLPNRTSASTSTVSAPLSVRLPPVSTTGGAGISLVRDHGINGSASASTTLTIPTTAAVAAGDYLVITGTSSSGTATLVSIAVTSGTDPGNLSWTGWDAVGNATGAFIAWTRCPTGVNNGVTFTITWSGVAFGTRRAGLMEWSGITSSGAQDAHQAAVSSSSSTNPTVNITTAGPNEVVIAGISIQTATTLTPNGTFLEIHDDNGGSRTHGTIYQLEASAGTYAPGATAASNNHWAISSIALVGAPVGGSGSNAQATAFRIRLPSRTSAGTSTADETALNLSGGPSNLPNETSDGTSTATAAALRIRLPNRSSSGTASPSASGLRIQLPQRTSAGTSTATATGLKIRLPSRTSAGTATCTANNIKIRLPNRTSAGTSTATAVGLQPKLPNRTSAGTSTATATAFKIRLPNRTSAGVATTTTTNLAGAVSNLQNVTSNGTGSCSANNLKIKLPSRSSAGSATCTASLRIRFPNRSSAGTSTTAQGGLKIRFASRTSAGTSTCTATALKVRLPIRTSTGTGTATAQAFRIRLPSRTSAGQATTTVTSLASGLVAQSHGSSTCTATAFKIRLPARTSSGTSNITQAGLRDRIALAVSSGQSTCTATGFRIKLPVRSTAGTSSTLGRLATRLPARTSAGHSTATSSFLRVGFHSFSSGSSFSSAQAFQIRLPSQHSNGTSDVFARRFLYIPPPAKVVISSSSSHVLTSSTAGHLVVASGPATSGSVTASSSSAVTPAGDLTKTVTASK